jgi:4-methyl-5(b-hydroxyethyl)-thiazole monophosphate biosynthesis
MGLLKERRATCYPGFEKLMKGAQYTAAVFTVDRNIVTAEGPAAAFAFGYELLKMLAGEETSRQIAEGMRYAHLMRW